MTHVIVREVCQGGGYHTYVKGETLPTGKVCLKTVRDYSPVVRHYEIRVDGKRADSRLSKRMAMQEAKRLADGGAVHFEANTLAAYRRASVSPSAQSKRSS